MINYSADTYKEEQRERQNKRRGFIASVVVHVLLLLLFWFVGLPYLDPPPAEEGILVNFGFTDTGFGDQPSEVLEEATEVAPAEAVPTPSSASSEQEINEVITQEEEITVPVFKKDDAKKDVKTEAPVKNETKNETVEETKEAVKETPVVDKRALFTGKKGTVDNPNHQGIAGGAGDQGKPWGDVNSDNYGDGRGKGTSGIGYDLGGRKHRDLPRPDDKSQATGIVVIRIKVDRNGNVAEASYQPKGSTTTNQSLIQAAITAAKKAKFDPDASANEMQFGTITYNFRVQ